MPVLNNNKHKEYAQYAGGRCFASVEANATSKSEEFRASAASFDKQAELAKDEEVKRLFREVADDWRSLAEQAQRHGW